MIYLLVPIALALPTASGWLLLRLAEGKTPVLDSKERVAAGLALGLVLTMFITFLLEITGIGNLSLWGMLSVQVLTCGVLGLLYYRKKEHLQLKADLPKLQLKLKNWQKVLVGALCVWTVLKLLAGWTLLIGPAYYDDSVSNWNLRGKMFYTQHELQLGLTPGKVDGVGSYPQTVPLVKAWFAHVGGSWHEGLVNSIHMVWYLCLVYLVYCALRKLISKTFSLIGTYILVSLPLLTMHTTGAYADAMLALHIFLAVSWLMFAVREKGDTRVSYTKLSAIAVALLVYTKNESILLHLPPIGLLLVLAIAMRRFSAKEVKTALLWFGGCTGAVLLPWLLFKWSNNLGFANAKNVSDLTMEWHEGVLQAIGVNMFFEGNWILLPGLFVALLLIRFQTAFKTSLVIATAFVLMVVLGQLPIYTLTTLATEAIMQTGYARGILHLMPLVVVVTTVLLEEIFGKTSKN